MRRFVYGILIFAVGCQPEAPAKKVTLQAEKPAASADGPDSIKIEPLTVSTAEPDIEKGKQVFTAKGCPACHKIDDAKLVGPGLKGVTARRTVPWIQRMILSPEVMVKEDPVAKQLLATHFTPMPAQGVDPKAELPALVAYLKSLEK